MYNACREYLITLLKNAGIKTEVFTNQKDLENNEEKHKAAVIAENDEVSWDGSKRIYIDEDGEKHKRLRKLGRKLSFIVTIGEYSAEACEALYEAFLRGLDKGLYINGDWTPIRLEPAQWYDEQDRVIKANVAVVFKVVFEGGVYQDTGFRKLSDILATAEMEGTK